MATSNQYAVITLENKTKTAMDVTVTIDFVDYFVISLAAGAVTKQLSPTNAAWRLSESVKADGDGGDQGRLASPGADDDKGVKMIERSGEGTLAEPGDDDDKGVKMIE